MKKIKKEIGVKDIYDFIGDDYNDPIIWRAIGSKYTAGLFQISSATYRQRMGRLKPRTIEQLAACLALVRGPCIASKADQKYMDIVDGKAEIELIHPIYDKVTAETNGILLYQEQFMQIFVDMGFSMEESYNAMKAAAKKNTDKLKAYEEEFMKRAELNKMQKDVATRIFKILVDTGLYSFNKSHAIAYAILTYITAFFKVYYTREFLCTSLTNAYERKEEVVDLIADCRRLGYSFLSVDINKSKWNFIGENEKDIRIGFSAVKSFGYAAYEEVKKFRPFNNIEELVTVVTKSNCGKRALIPAIFTGAFNGLHDTPLESYREYMKALKEKEDKISDVINIQGSKDKLSIYGSDMDFEQAFFGALLISDPINDFNSIGLDNIPNGQSFNIVGIYDKIKKHKTKAKQEPMAFFTIKTGDGTIECTIFPKQYSEYKKLVKKNLVCNFSLRRDKDGKYIVNKIEVA